jgi:uncharacterized delta-60 repeat protein
MKTLLSIPSLIAESLRFLIPPPAADTQSLSRNRAHLSGIAKPLWAQARVLAALLPLAIANLAGAAGPGDLDPAFGTGGVARTDFGNTAQANAVFLQPDGKIVAAGEAYSASASKYGMGVARYLSDGTLDTSFSSDGKTITIWTGNGSGQARAYSVAVQADGKIIAAGSNENSQLREFITLVRYNVDGTFDTSFGSNGTVSTTAGVARGLALQPDRRIVVVGETSSLGGGIVVRYNENGGLDGTFGSAGKVVLDFADARSLVLQPDGKIVVAGAVDVLLPDGFTRQTAFAVERLNSDGTLDPGFGENGRVTTLIRSGSDHAYSVTLQADGKIVVAGESYEYRGVIAVVRYTANGTLDSTFGTKGKVLLPVPSSGFGGETIGVASQADGAVVITAGISKNSTRHIALFRLTAAGQRDQSFGDNGLVQTGAVYPGEGRNIRIASAGALLVVGQSDSSGFAILKYRGGSAPRATISRASIIDLKSATLRGTIHPNGFVTAAHFEYGTTTSYDQTAQVALSPTDGKENQEVSATVESLQPFTTYHYRLVATSSEGTTVTEDSTFTTYEPVAFVKNGFFQPAISVSEKYAESVPLLYTDPDSDASFYGLLKTYTGSATIAFRLGDQTTFDATTKVGFSIGGLSFSSTLGQAVEARGADGSTDPAELARLLTAKAATFKNDFLSARLTWNTQARTASLTVTLNSGDHLLAADGQRWIEEIFDERQTFFAATVAPAEFPNGNVTIQGRRRPRVEVEFGRSGGTRRVSLSGSGSTRKVTVVTVPADNVDGDVIPAVTEDYILHSYTAAAAADYVAPALTITQPANSATLLASAVTLKGTVSGDVAQITILVPDPTGADPYHRSLLAAQNVHFSPTAVPGLKGWSADVSLQELPADPGDPKAKPARPARPANKNLFDISAADQDGNATTKSLTLFYEPWAGSYSLLLFPAATDDTTLPAVLTLTVTKTKGVTGKVSVGAKSYAFRGTVGDDGSIVVTSTGLTGFDVSGLKFSIADDTHTLSPGASGITANGVVYVRGSATGRALSHASNQPSGFAGYYTSAIDGETVLAQHAGLTLDTAGNCVGGYATARVTPAGLVAITGKLADNTSFSFGGALDGHGAIPVFVPLYSAKGWLAGNLRFSTIRARDGSVITSAFVGRNDEANSAFFTWRYPGGATLRTNALGETSFQAPITLRGWLYRPGFTGRNPDGTPVTVNPFLYQPAAGQIQLADGNLANPVTEHFHINGISTIVVDGLLPSGSTDGNPSKVSFTVANSTGLFTGGFKDGTLQRSFNGAIVQSYDATNAGWQTEGAGFFLGSKTTLQGTTRLTTPVIGSTRIAAAAP